MNKLPALITYDFRNNRLHVFASTSSILVPNVAPIFRHYPLTELEARALHFQGSSPISWVEKHVLDVLRLAMFDSGYDARDIEWEIEFGWSLVQRESDGEHVYKWVHDRVQDRLILTDNGQEIVFKNTRGPQNYQDLGYEMAAIRALDKGTELRSDEVSNSEADSK
jgi:hypothetical protein